MLLLASRAEYQVSPAIPIHLMISEGGYQPEEGDSFPRHHSLRQTTYSIALPSLHRPPPMFMVVCVGVVDVTSGGCGSGHNFLGGGGEQTWDGPCDN